MCALGSGCLPLSFICLQKPWTGLHSQAAEMDTHTHTRTLTAAYSFEYASLACEAVSLCTHTSRPSFGSNCHTQYDLALQSDVVL